MVIFIFYIIRGNRGNNLLKRSIFNASGVAAHVAALLPQSPGEATNQLPLSCISDGSRALLRSIISGVNSHATTTAPLIRHLWFLLPEYR